MRKKTKPTRDELLAAISASIKEARRRARWCSGSSSSAIESLADAVANLAAIVEQEPRP